MNFDKMSTNEIKAYAKSKGIKFTNISREKLIDKIKDFEAKSETVSSVISVEDDDFTAPVEKEEVKVEQTKPDGASILSSIEAAIDELNEEDVEDYDNINAQLPPPVEDI